MNRGVVTTPWGVWKQPQRARVRGHWAVIVKGKAASPGLEAGVAIGPLPALAGPGVAAPSVGVVPLALKGPAGGRSAATLGAGRGRIPAHPWPPRPMARSPQPSAPSWLADLAGAWVFYSVLPLPPGLRPRFERIARFAPWIGLLIGALEALLWAAGEGRLPLLAQVALVLALGHWISGGLHLDGAMDTADGLAAGRERCLEAMDDSRVGASGVQAMVQLLLLRVAALAMLAAAAPWGLAWAAVWGRIAPLVAMQAFPYLRDPALRDPAGPDPAGVAAGTAGFHRRHWRGLGPELLPAALLLVLLTAGAQVWAAGGWWWQGWLGLLPALLVPWRLGHQLGGHSGDSYGACVEWTTSWSLLLFALARLLPG